MGRGWDQSISGMSLLKDNINVTLYDQPNCKGASYSPNRNKFNDIALNFNDRTKSVRVCETLSQVCVDTGSQTTSRDSPVHVMLYEHEDRIRGRYGYDSFRMSLTQECTNVPSKIKTKNGTLWNEAISDVELIGKTLDMSLILFDDLDCAGVAYFPSQGPQRNRRDLMENFNDRTKSIRVCESVDCKPKEKVGSMCYLDEDDEDGYELTFYENPRSTVTTGPCKCFSLSYGTVKCNIEYILIFHKFNLLFLSCTNVAKTLKLQLGTSCKDIPDFPAPQYTLPWKESISDMVLN